MASGREKKNGNHGWPSASGPRFRGPVLPGVVKRLSAGQIWPYQNRDRGCKGVRRKHVGAAPAMIVGMDDTLPVKMANGTARVSSLIDMC